MEKVGDIWERGRALLAWKLNSRDTVVEVVVVLSSGVVGGSSGVYQRIRGEETVNTKQAYANRCMAYQMQH